MGKMANETIDKIDDNNMKAMEILRSIMKIASDECTGIFIGGVDALVLLDAAFDLLKSNDHAFNNCK